MAQARETDEVEDVEETVETAEETETEEVETEETVEETETEEETEAEAEEEAEETAAPVKPQSRAARRIQSLNERLAKAERDLEEVRRRPAPVDPNAAAEQARRDAEEDERVILSGDAGAIARHFAQKSEKRVEAKLGAVVNHVVDAADKTEFRALCAEKPSLASVRDEVEEELAKSRAQGLNPKREYLAYIILGRRIASREKGARTRQEKRAGEERRRQQSRPGSARSDVSRQPSRGGSSEHEKRAKRLDESGLL